MTKFDLTPFRSIFLLLCVLMMTACRDDGSDDGPNVEPLPDVYITLLASSAELPTDGTSTISLTAIVKNSENNLIEGYEVQFSSTAGAIQVLNSHTGPNGIASAELTLGGEKSNQSIVVTVDDGYGRVVQKTINAVGTYFIVSGAEKVEIGSNQAYVAQLLDAGDNPIAQQEIEVATVWAENTLESTTLVTDVEGKVYFTLNGVMVGDETITVNALNATNNTLDVRVVYPSKWAMSYVAPEAGEMLVDISHHLRVKLSESGSGVAGKAILLSTTRGVFASSSLAYASHVTDGSGFINDTISSSSTGDALIRAEWSEGLLSTELNIAFISDSVDVFTGQASLPYIYEGQSSEIVVTVRDKNLNPVKNKSISFTINSDPTNGQLSTPTAITDDVGKASVTYTAGMAINSQDNVQLQVFLQENPNFQDTINLVVTRQQYHVSLGGGNVINKVSGGAVNEFAYAAIVVDSRGAPVSNQPVELKVSSRNYYKGNYYKRYNGLGEFVSWDNALNGNEGRIVECQSEDINENGVFDPIIDFDENGNGKLDPGVIVTLGDTENATVYTDENGVAAFSILYPAEYGGWMNVYLRATTDGPVGGASQSTLIALPVFSGDLLDENAPPPGAISPFGRGYDETTQSIMNCSYAGE